MPDSGSILHLITVGFHHRHGAVVELAYPPLVCGSDAQVAESPRAALPDKWKHLASLALPDGAHNYLKDAVYFTLPSLEKEDIVVYGVASYRQMDSETFAQHTPEVTRNTVQKSLVVLTRFPVFSFVAHHLSHLIEQLFAEGGFTMERLQNAYAELDTKLSAVLNNPSAYQSAVLFNISAANFVRVYGRDALTLFKLLLLERRVLFAGESAGAISLWIITLLSLVPDLLITGLTHCCLVDPSWISERACWPILCNPTIPSTVNKSEESSIQQHNNASSDETTSLLPVDQNPSGFQLLLDGSASTVTLDRDFNIPPSHQSEISEKVSSAGSMASLDTLSPQPSESQPNPSQTAYPTRSDTFGVVDDSLFSPFPTDDWGFPLALFTKSYILPIYLPLISLDPLLESTTGRNLIPTEDSPEPAAPVTDRSVRAFLAGATNPLLRTHKHLAEVIVTSLSPTEGLTEAEWSHSHGLLTSLFDGNNRLRRTQPDPMNVPTDGSSPSLSGSVVRQAGNPNRPAAPKKPDPVIQILSPSNPSSTVGFNARTFPVSLAQALHLTRVDRAFIDELNKTVVVWYQARTAVQQICQLDPSDDLSVLLQGDEKALDRLLDRLLPEQKTVILRFPSTTILDLYVRQQFQSYLRALLLTAEGYGSNTGDFSTHYVNCLRSTRAFSVWRRQFMPDKLFRVSKPQPVPVVETAVANDDTQLQTTDSKEIIDRLTRCRLVSLPIYETPAEFSSAADVLALHPGRRHAETDDWDQLVDGFKKFRELAADRGRRLMSQGVQGLSKLGNDLNASFRSSSSSSVVSRFSDAFRSLLNSAAHAANHWDKLPPPSPNT